METSAATWRATVVAVGNFKSMEGLLSFVPHASLGNAARRTDFSRNEPAGSTHVVLDTRARAGAAVRDVHAGAAEKFFAVARGNEVGIFFGIYNEVCEPKVKGFKGALFKGFKSRVEAIAYLEQNGVSTGGWQMEAPQQQRASELSAEISARTYFRA